METYDEIYGRMKNAYEHETGDSFNEVSDIAIRLKVLAGEIFKLQTNLEEPDSSGLYGAVEKAADQIWLELDLSVFADHEADRRKAAEKDHGGASPTGR